MLSGGYLPREDYDGRRKRREFGGEKFARDFPIPNVCAMLHDMAQEPIGLELMRLSPVVRLVTNNRVFRIDRVRQDWRLSRIVPSDGTPK